MSAGLVTAWVLVDERVLVPIAFDRDEPADRIDAIADAVANAIAPGAQWGFLPGDVACEQNAPGDMAAISSDFNAWLRLDEAIERNALTRSAR
jgi:hypothetical protein